MDSEIFINYRGEDSRSYSALLYVELSRCFGSERVFLDSESIPAGADFAEQLLGRVRRAAAVLAVIGPGWLAAAGPRWRPRIKDQADWTRLELTEAFAAGVRVIPVLTDDAKPPTERELPPCLAPLSRCQYRRLRHRDAMADLTRIIAELVDAVPGLAEAARGRMAAFQSRPAGLDRWRRELARWNGQPNPAPAIPTARPTARAVPVVRPTNPPSASAYLDLYRTLVAGRRRFRSSWDPPYLY